ncbi:MAG: hypothetical protein U1E70_14670 [Acetobacteraceae bacterium]|nr:hypothetical protein [Pseudomonadota bacterium]
MSQPVPAAAPAWSALRASWLSVVVFAGVGGSFLLACSMPFVAVASIAALTMHWIDGIAAVLLVWLANQAIGFGLSYYPWTLDGLVWGTVTGLAALAALGAAAAFASPRPVRLGFSLPFVAAFAGYQLVLYEAGTWLNADPAAFSLAALRQAFVVNLIAFAALLILHAIARALGRTNPQTPYRFA